MIVKVERLQIDLSLSFYSMKDQSLLSLQTLFTEYEQYLENISIPQNISTHILKDSLKLIAEAMKDKIIEQMKEKQYSFKETLLFLRDSYLQQLHQSQMSLYAEIVSFFDNFFFFLQFKNPIIERFCSPSAIAMDNLIYFALSKIEDSNFKGFFLRKENFYPTHLFLLLQSCHIPIFFIEKQWLNKCHQSNVEIDFDKKYIYY